MKLQLMQLETTRDKQRNLDRAVAAIRETDRASDKDSLVVFPEMYMALPTDAVALSEVAEGLDGPFVAALKQAALDAGTYVACGMWERNGESNRVFNTVVVLSPTGELVTSYRKLHLFDALSVRESDRMVAGSHVPPTVQIGESTVGFATCYDLRFPELFRDLALRGADLAVLPSAWYAGAFKEDHWLTLLRARAIENTMYVAGADLPAPKFCGRSTVFDPFGVPVAGAGEGETTIWVEIDAARVSDVRGKLPSLEHVRRDLYSLGAKA